MGKKRVAKKSTEELIQEREAVDQAVEEARQEKKSRKRQIGRGEVYVTATWNNTLLSLTDLQGNVVAQTSAGSIGFRGTKKSTPFAASRAAEALAEKAKGAGVQRVSVTVKGIGGGRESAIRSLASHGLEIISIRDRTPIPHNGPRRPKPRRV